MISKIVLTTIIKGGSNKVGFCRNPSDEKVVFQGKLSLTIHNSIATKKCAKYVGIVPFYSAISEHKMLFNNQGVVRCVFLCAKMETKCTQFGSRFRLIYLNFQNAWLLYHLMRSYKWLNYHSACIFILFLLNI